jgi:hypothetical protein
MIKFKPFQNLYQQIKAKDMRLFEALDKISAYLQNIGTIIDSMFDARGNLTVLNGVNLQIPNKLIKVTTPGVLGLSNVSDDGTTVTIPESVLVTGDVNTTGNYRIGGSVVIAPTELANTALMGPVSGGAALPAFRALTATDIPSINATQVNGASIPSSAPLLQTNLSGQLISRTDGVTGVMPIPKLTTLGSNGSIAFLNGVVTAYVNPT